MDKEKTVTEEKLEIIDCIFCDRWFDERGTICIDGGFREWVSCYECTKKKLPKMKKFSQPLNKPNTHD